MSTPAAVILHQSFHFVLYYFKRLNTRCRCCSSFTSHMPLCCSRADCDKNCPIP